MFDGCLKIPSEERPVEVAFIADGYVANHLAAAGEDPVGIGKQGAAIEAEIYVGAVRGDVAKSILQRFAGKREADRDGIPFGDRFDGVGRFVKNDLSQS